MASLGVFGFWIFISVLYVTEAWLFSKGYDTFIFSHKSDEEKRLRTAAIKQAERGVTGTDDGMLLARCFMRPVSMIIGLMATFSIIIFSVSLISSFLPLLQSYFDSSPGDMKSVVVSLGLAVLAFYLVLMVKLISWLLKQLEGATDKALDAFIRKGAPETAK